MNDQDVANHITSLEARMNRIEKLMEQLLLTLTSSTAHMDQTGRMSTMVQELRGGSAMHSAPPAMETSQERPEIAAIHQALLAGNKLKAIQLYRSLYGVGLQEAQEAISRM